MVRSDGMRAGLRRIACCSAILTLLSPTPSSALDARTAPNAGVVGPQPVHGIVGRTRSDSSDVVAVVAAYHAALAAGDSAAALALLAPDAVIVESGGVETRDAYRAHHLPADIAFARAIKGERGPIRVVVEGDVAWASSTSISQGEYRGRQINSSSAELMVLSRVPGGWRIRAIHWSSRARRQ